MKKSVALVLGFIILAVCCFAVSFIEPEAKNGFENDTENDGFYIYKNSIVKAESKLNTAMADYAIRLFNRVNDEMLDDSNSCYFVLVPDKEKLINDNFVYYDEFYGYFNKGLEFATPIEIYDLLQFSDYYRSDPHIRQERLVDIAIKISGAMNNECESEFTVNSTDIEFIGSYVRQSGFDTVSDEFKYLSSEVIDGLTVSDGIELYNFDKLKSDNPYDFFMSGNQSVVKIKNDSAKSEKRLVVFGDSFASSLAPLLATAYNETVLVDLRYIMSDYVADYVDFDNADVLFMYSTLLLNNSMSMK